MQVFQRVARFSAIISIAVLGACAPTPPPAVQHAPPPFPLPESGRAAMASAYMVSAANPYAVEAGLAILKKGGSAIDAAIATQLVLGLVEPQSSGIGGGGFLMHYNAENGDIAAYDGRETAPTQVDPRQFLNEDGEPVSYVDAAVGGQSVGVPGLLAMLEMAHGENGVLDWAELFAPAIDLAENGFTVSPRLAQMVADDEHLKVFKSTRAYFHPQGKALQAGDTLKNPKLAATYRKVASQGAKAFTLGSIGYDVIQTARNAEHRPSLMTSGDFVAYRAIKRAPLCQPYRDWLVCGMPSPSSGGLATLQILGQLQGFDMGAPMNENAVHLLAEASKRAFADRDTYVGDPRFVPVPELGLIDPEYLRLRADEIGEDATPTAHPGMPGMLSKIPYAPGTASHGVSTTHLSVIDADGNAVSLTSTIGNEFGSRLMVRGFLLNNQLTDFSFRPEVDGAPVANAIEPRKRPRSSMAPTLVFNMNGDVVAATGSPGGSKIIGYVAQSLIALLDWGLDPQQAASLPHALNRNGALEIEADTAAEALAPALKARGHAVETKTMTSGLHILQVKDGKLLGGADPRREGVAKGE